MKDTKDALVNNAKIEKFILDYMANPKLNTIKEIEGPAFDTPLVGFSLATDSYYEYYKNHIDPNFYRLPQEWLKSFYNQDFDPANISIISWVLPQTENTRNLASKQKDCPTMEWEMVRVHGEECNRDMAISLQNWFRDKGIKAIAPIASPEFAKKESERFYVISNWSERHTAFISGLGTFGLCDGQSVAYAKLPSPANPQSQRFNNK